MKAVKTRMPNLPGRWSMNLGIIYKAIESGSFTRGPLLIPRSQYATHGQGISRYLSFPLTVVLAAVVMASDASGSCLNGSFSEADSHREQRKAYGPWDLRGCRKPTVDHVAKTRLSYS